jgi:transcriptional regulator with XRE-family HTH domain
VSDASTFVATRLRQFRNQASLTQEQAATLVGLTFKYYQRLESGTVKGMRLSTVEQVAQAYGVDLLSFFSKRNTKLGKILAVPPPHRQKRKPRVKSKS